jgi:PAS domain S-box-containing protein
MPAAAPIAQPKKNTAQLLLFFIFLTFGAIIGQTWWSVVEDKKLTLETEKKNALTAVRLLEEHAVQTLRDVDRNMDGVITSIISASYTREIDENFLREFVNTGKKDSRYLSTLQFTTPKGVSLVSSLDYPAHQVDHDDRTYIPFLLAHHEQKNTVVGRAFMRYYDRKMVVPLARNIFNNEGKYIGIIGMDISISYFSEVYARIASGGKALVSLFSDEGHVIVRSPFDKRFLSLDISKSPVMANWKSKPDEGWFIDNTFLGDKNAVPRLYSYRKIKTYGVTAVFARDMDSILLDWRTRTLGNIGYAGVFIGIHLILTYFLAKHINRLNESELSLQQNIERLNQSEASLRISETKFIGMFQHSPVPLSVMRLADEFIFEVNDSLLTQFGYARDAFIGKTLANVQLWEDQNSHQLYLDQLRQLGFVEHFEVAMQHQNGQVLFCLLSARIFENEGEKMVIFSPIDVTRQREIENEIRELNAQLEERVSQRTKKLEKSNLELGQALESLKNAQGELLRAEKMAALGSLVAGVAHELNTPIGNSVTVASTLNEWIQKMAETITSPKPSRTLMSSGVQACVSGVEILVRNLDRAAELVMSFKQVAVDQSSNQKRNFDLRQSIEEVVRTLGPMYQKTPFKLEMDLATGISMNSYPGALGQVITNFVTNALAHAFEGRTTGMMRIRTTKLGDRVEIEFSDDGVGIPEKYIARVFDPFFTTKLGQGGSGLGMHIVYNLINDILGGKIELFSTPGEGTRLLVNLPLEVAGNDEENVN